MVEHGNSQQNEVNGYTPPMFMTYDESRKLQQDPTDQQFANNPDTPMALLMSVEQITTELTELKDAFEKITSFKSKLQIAKDMCETVTRQYAATLILLHKHKKLPKAFLCDYKKLKRKRVR